MIEYSETTVFNAPVQTIVNTINCVGIMGAGIALEFKMRYPEMYHDYVKQCRRGNIKVGHLYFYQREERPWIINFPTKNHWKYPSRLNWIEAGLIYFLDNYQQWGIKSVAFPKLGCDRGGLEWSEVQQVMREYLSNAKDIDIYICLDNDSQAQGIEKQMLEILHNSEPWGDLTILTQGEVEAILKSLPIERFRNLQKIVSSEQYQRLFKVLYTLALSEKVSPPVKQKLSPKDSRLHLILLLKKFNIPPEVMCQLTWENFQQEYGCYWLKWAGNQRIVLPDETWSNLVTLKGDVTNNTPLIHSLKNSQKILNCTTLKRLLNEVKKIHQQE